MKDGEPCSHPGCLSHVSHSCEGCGRIAGREPTAIEAEIIRRCISIEAQRDSLLRAAKIALIALSDVYHAPHGQSASNLRKAIERIENFKQDDATGLNKTGGEKIE